MPNIFRAKQADYDKTQELTAVNRPHGPGGRHYLAFVTGHGLGHLAQTVEMLGLLATAEKKSRFTICTSLDEQRVRERSEPLIPAERLAYLPDDGAVDIGMLMHDALDTDAPASLAAYRAIHAQWDRHTDHYISLMRASRPDHVLCNVAYLPLLAARRLGIPAAALCSLDWAGVFRHFCTGKPGAHGLFLEMVAAYSCADLFLQLQPHMPMPYLEKVHSVGPLARQGRRDRKALEAALPGYAGERIGLASMGGMPVAIPYAEWPRIPGVRWIVAPGKDLRDDLTGLDSLGMRFSDVLASCDFVLGKTGYGMVVESALSGVPMLYLPRADWPEEPGMLQWSQQNNRTLVVTQEQVMRGRLAAAIDRLLRMKKPPSPMKADAGQLVSLLHANRPGS